MSYYYFIQNQLQSGSSNFPSAGKLNNSATSTLHRRIKEDKFAFVGDVNRFLDKELEWWQRVIVLARVPNDIADERSYGQLVNILMSQSVKNGKVYPKSLTYRPNLRREFKKIVQKANRHFREKGYLD